MTTSRASCGPTPTSPRRCAILNASHSEHAHRLTARQGIVFLDIFPILRDPVAFETLITHFVYHLTSATIPRTPAKKIDVVVGLDARGFLLGPIIAMRLGAAFVPVRKQGKLPGECVKAQYEKEYGVVSILVEVLRARWWD